MVNRFVLPRLPRATLGALVTMAVLTVGAQNAHAQSNWNGGTGDWNVSTNWTPTGVPNSPSTDVSITGTSGNLSSVTIDNLAPAVHNLSLDSFSTLSISAGQGLLVAGPSLSNAGQINVGNGTLYADVNGGTVTLSGGGAISLTNTNTQIRGAYGNETLVNTNNTIQGQGSISTLASFQNQGTVNANVSGGTLEINAPTTNTGTLQATGGGTLSIFATTVNNAGGTISTNSSSSVAIYDSTINGGTLDSGGSVIHATSNVFLNGVTLTAGSIYSVDPSQATLLTGDLTNKGTVNVGGAATLYADSNAGTINLTGGGTINLTASNDQIRGYYGNETLVNKDNTIQGQGSISTLASFQNQGTVNANVSGGTLEINAPTTNTGTLQATGGGTLSIFATTVNNAGYTISSDASSHIAIYDSTINGGTLDSGGSVIHATSNVFLNGVTLTTGSIYSVDPNSATLLTGDLTNRGTVNVGGAAALYADNNGGTINLTGGGTINLTASNDQIRGFYGNETLVNKDNTIQGQGSISTLASFQNQGTVLANVSGGTLSISNTLTTNSGTFQVNEGSTLQVNGSFTTTGTVNIGAVSDVSPSLFQVLGSNDYVQTSGTTSLWSAQSTLAVATNQAVNIEGGLLQGIGTVQGNLINSGTVHPGLGDGPGILTVTGNYTQNSSGSLNIAIGGLTQGSGYSVLSVTGLASLSGTLDVSLVNGFSPVTNDIFVILTSGGLSGQFTDNTIQVGNVTFDVEYSPAGYTNDVVLEVAQVSSSAVPEPASWLIGLGLTAVGTCVVRKTRSQFRGK